MAEIEPIRWRDGHLELLDQRLLPAKQEWLVLHTAQQVADAIRQMAVRGAPAIGVTAAYGMVLAAGQVDADSMERFLERLNGLVQELSQARPTAVNLAWAVERCLSVAGRCATPDEARQVILDLCRSAGAKTVTKGKSMIAEEIALNEFLEDHDIEPIETDLGEYIIQLAGEPPSHIIAPAVHMTKEDVADLFFEKHQVYGMPRREEPF